MTNPYKTLPAEAFWRTGAVDPGPDGIARVYRPKFPVTRDMRIATQGSCFAQQIGKELVRRGFNWFEAEPPLPCASAEVNRLYNYGVFTYRTGNIYTTRLLRQWLEWASGIASPPDEAWVEKDGFVDPFRPRIEPEPYPDRETVRATRQKTISSMADTLGSIDLFIFTLGLTEAWEDRDTGVVYPMCPGAAGGAFEAARHAYVNYRFPEIVEDLEAAVTLLKRHNAQMKILLTVSPVPMVATASGQHVLVANGRTKNTLRAVAADLAERRDDVDYFPGYELVREPPFGNAFFEENMRAVTREGVAYVMNHFLGAHDEAFGAGTSGASGVTRAGTGSRKGQTEEELVCEEILLDAAAPR